VFESTTLARGNIGHAAGLGVGEWLYGEKLARIHWATPEEELTAFAYYRKHQDTPPQSVSPSSDLASASPGAGVLRPNL